MVKKLTTNFRIADPAMLILAVLATVLGTFMIYDAGFPQSLRRFGTIPREFLMQALVGCIMIVVAAVVSRIDIDWWRKRASIILAASALLLMVLWVPGMTITANGATRWINLRVFSLQPSEFAKLATIIFLAAHFAARSARVEMPTKIKSWSSKMDWTIAKRLPRALPLFLIVAIAVKVEFEPDLGTASVILAVMMGMFVLGGVSKRSLATLALFGGLAVALVVMKEPYRLERILNHNSRWSKANIDDVGFQTTRSETAIAAGGLVGVGPGAGAAKHFMPAATTDYVMATVGEEFGFMGSLFVIALMAGITWRFAALSQELLAKGRLLAKEPTPDKKELARVRFAGFFLGGVACWLGVQSSVNIMMGNGFLPAIGIPLPFFSSGGSSLIVLWMSVAIGQSAAAALNPAPEEVARESSNNRRRNRRPRLSST
ncbi:MAG: FtsW/RodA/SpoVE family cell cycle protein [Armatimonadetes bacterium]|nr:FtsW/RodA/SpoVE family cell cycle protein [Armatimonadota bacterium]